MAGTGARDLARWTACVLLLGLFVAPTASADEIRYVGQTSQDRKVVMKTDPRGAIKSWQGKLRATRAATEFAIGRDRRQVPRHGHARLAGQPALI